MILPLMSNPTFVIPAKAGTQSGPTLGPRFRGDDEEEIGTSGVGFELASSCLRVNQID